MNRLFSAKPLLAAAIAFGSLGAAQARSDVYFSIGFNAPYGYVQPAPVYVPQSVYYQPAPVYYEPAPVYYQPQPVYYVNRQHRWHERRGAWRDADRDGVPNIYDRAPHNPYRR